MLPAVDYDHAHPGEAFLIVEVSDASLGKDRRLKTEVYAKAGVPEYWVVNLVDRVIEIYGEAQTPRMAGWCPRIQETR